MTELYEETEIEFEFLVSCVVLELNGSSYIMLLLVLTNVLTFTRRSVIFVIGKFLKDVIEASLPNWKLSCLFEGLINVNVS